MLGINNILKVINLKISYVWDASRSFSCGMESIKGYFDPDLIVDIGVANGTPSLYSIFPEKKYLLIEANENYKPQIERILKQIDGEAIYCMCGDAMKNVDLNIYKDQKKSSKYEICRSIELEKVEKVQQYTLDDIFAMKNIACRTLLKIDVEGAELDVIRGINKSLQYIDVVVVETSITERYSSKVVLSDVSSLLLEKGFVLTDILNLRVDKSTHAPIQVDAVFGKRNHFT